MAMTATYITVLRGHDSESLEITRHLSQTLHLVNRDLSTGAVPQDPTVAVVVFLAMHSNLTGAVHKSYIHLDGLQRILELRPGGLEALQVVDMNLAQKIRRANVEYSLLTGRPTQLRRQSVGPPLLLMYSLPQHSQGVILPGPLGRIDISLQHITRHVFAFCACAGKSTFEPHQYQDIILSIFQELLDFAPLANDRPTDALDDAWHLGLVLFMTTIMYPNGQLRVNYFGLLIRLLRTRLNDPEFTFAPDYCRLQLWLFFFYGFSVLEGCDGRWLFHRIRALASELDLKTWEQAREHLCLFPWIGFIHDGMGEMLWDSAVSSVVFESGGNHVVCLTPGL